MNYSLTLNNSLIKKTQVTFKTTADKNWANWVNCNKAKSMMDLNKK